MQTKNVDEQFGTAEDAARRLLLVQSVSTTIDRWAIDYQDKIPEEGRSAFAACRHLLAGEIVGLIDSLTTYDVDIVALSPTGARTRPLSVARHDTISWRRACRMRRPSVSRMREIRTSGLKGDLRKRSRRATAPEVYQ